MKVNLFYQILAGAFVGGVLAMLFCKYVIGMGI